MFTELKYNRSAVYSPLQEAVKPSSLPSEVQKKPKNVYKEKQRRLQWTTGDFTLHSSIGKGQVQFQCDRKSESSYSPLEKMGAAACPPSA